MLSKVLNNAERKLAQPVLFAAIGSRQPERGAFSAHAGSEGSGDAEELRKSRERIHKLEAECAAATRDAFEEGLQEGQKQAHVELAPVLDRLKSAAAEVIGMRPDLRRAAERDAVQLALLIARRILHRELNVDSNALTALARVVFERLTRAESYRVIVHPQFAEAMRSVLPGNQLSRVQIEPDPSAAPGTLRIHCDEGTIDASIDVQLEEISRVFPTVWQTPEPYEASTCSRSKLLFGDPRSHRTRTH